MKRKLIVAVATVLVLANGTSVAFADSGSNSESNKKKTEEKKNADEKKNANSNDSNSNDSNSNDAFEAKRDAYLVQLEAIRTTFRTSLVDAENALRTARASATTDEALALAEVAVKTSGAASLKKYQDSLIDLDLKPVKPDLSDEQTYAKKVDAAAFKARRVAILEAFRAAMESARETFKTAKRSATTDEAKKAAESAFKTAISMAKQIKTDALKALGDNSSHTGGSEGDK